MLGFGCRWESVEIVFQADVGEELVAVFVEMQKRFRAAIESAARFFLERAFAQFDQKRFETIKGCEASVFHTPRKRSARAKNKKGGSIAASALLILGDMLGLNDAALVLADDDTAGVESGLEDRKGLTRFGVSAHEDVECRVAFFRPCMNADVAFGENGNT